MATAAPDPAAAALLARSLTPERLSTYLTECQGSLPAALVLYQWNTEATGAFWETLGQWEVLLRNVIDGQLRRRHVTRGRPGSWLDDPAGELIAQARSEIEVARRRVHRKGKALTDGQIVSELPFGFWRFLISRRYTNLWPDMATGFPHAPDRRLSTIETPVAHLHELRNRLAHQQRIWSEPLRDRYTEMIDLAGYIDPALARWLHDSSRVTQVQAARP
jgi:hypothetical protein